MPATIYPIASTGAMLDIGQERSREIAALAAEPRCVSDSNCIQARSTGTILLSERVSDSHNHPSGLTGGPRLTKTYHRSPVSQEASTAFGGDDLGISTEKRHRNRKGGEVAKRPA